MITTDKIKEEYMKNYLDRYKTEVLNSWYYSGVSLLHSYEQIGKSCHGKRKNKIPKDRVNS